MLATCALYFSGCTTPKKETVELDAKGKPIEYVWITPVGSHIAIKVPKDQAQTGEVDREREKQSIQNVLNRGTKQNPDIGSN